MESGEFESNLNMDPWIRQTPIRKVNPNWLQVIKSCVSITLVTLSNSCKVKIMQVNLTCLTVIKEVIFRFCNQKIVIKSVLSLS